MKRTKEQNEIVFNATHKDYKGTIKGVKYVMYFDEKQGSVYSPLSKMPDSIFKERLKQAESKSKVIEPTEEQKKNVLNMTKTINNMKSQRSSFVKGGITYKAIQQSIDKAEKELTNYRNSVGLKLK